VAITSTEVASVRYLVDDVDRAIDFYTTQLGFTLGHNVALAHAEVTRGPLRLLLSGPTSSGARPMPDGTTPVPGRHILLLDPAGNPIELFHPASR
jgi:predicted enzyme related to lactoylglutathione lyase